MSNVKKIAKIVPFQKLPRGRDCFDYLIPDGLEATLSVGQIVKIPFGKRVIKGLVIGFGSEQKTNFDLKEIVGATNNLGFAETQVALLRWFSRYYYYSLGSTLKLMLPDEPKRKAKQKSEIAVHNIGQRRKMKANDVGQILDSTTKKFLLFPYQDEQRETLYLGLVENIIAQNGQVLIVFPQIENAKQFYSNLSPRIKPQAIVLTNEITRSKNLEYEAWNKISNNQTKIVIGTRSAIFAPLNKLRLIIIDKADSDDYKQWDQVPKYQTVTVARKIQELHSCKLIISSITPRIEDAFVAKQEKYQQIILGHSVKPNINVIDLSQAGANIARMDNNIIDKIKEAVRKKRKCLLVINKRGAFSHVSCGDCGHVFSCDICSLPITIGLNDEFICYRCKRKLPINYKCPNCSGIKYKKFGYGIEQIKKDLERELAIKAQILGDGSIDDAATVYLSSVSGIDDVIYERISYLDFVYVDSLLYLGDYSVNFRLYSALSQITQKYSQKNPAEKIILQTSFPENSAIAGLARDYSYFYKSEIAIRQSFGYPPFTNLIKLSFDHHDESVARSEADDLYQKLKNNLDFAKIRITEPYAFYARKVRTRYRYEIGLFLPAMTLDQENKLLAIVPTHWTIDKDPKDLL